MSSGARITAAEISYDDPERYPFRRFLPRPIHWIYRTFRTVLVALNFAVFWLGACVLAWLLIPLVALWPGSQLARTRRSQRRLRWSFHAFHLMMRVCRLYHRRAVYPSARPHGDRVETPAILVANHPTLCDVTSIGSLYPNVVCVAKAIYAGNPFMGRLLRMCGFVPTGRTMLDECAGRLQMGFDMLIFPEGTRSPASGGLQPFQRGAFELSIRTGTPVVLLKLTCRPPALSKRLPIWKTSDRMAVLVVEPIEIVDPASYDGDSRAMCRDVEQRYRQLIVGPDPTVVQQERKESRGA